MRRLSVAVLAGGSSSRMGTDKAMLELDGQVLVGCVVDRLTVISDDVFVVAKRPLPLEARVVLDDVEDQTPLAGIIAALKAARHPLVFICACDMPFVSLELVDKLADRAEEFEAAVPTHDDRFQSLHAVWSKVCLPKLEALWAQGERAVFKALQRLDVYVVNAAAYEESFTNVNTPEELAAIRSRRA